MGTGNESCEAEEEVRRGRLSQWASKIGHFHSSYQARYVMKAKD
jgi:hypothetical protein